MVSPLRVETPERSDLISAHEHWLADDNGALTSWQSRLDEPGKDHESAVAEAAVRWVLTQYFESVLPGEVCGRGADFRCLSDAETRTVEVTNLTRETLNRDHSSPIYKKIFNKVQHKTTKQQQAASSADPFVLAVTTQHSSGAQEIVEETTANFLLTGRQSVYMPPAAASGERVSPTWLASEECSAFHRQDQGGIDSESLTPIRQEVSGLLLVGIHETCVQMTGLLNPWAVRRIDSIGLEGLPTVFVQGIDPNQFTLCWKS